MEATLSEKPTELTSGHKRLDSAAYLISSVLDLPCAVVDVEGHVMFQHPEKHIGACFCKQFEKITGKRYSLDHFFERCHRIGFDSSNSIYTCPFGLVNVLVPVFEDDEYCAAVQVGPFMVQDSEEFLIKQGLAEIDMSAGDESLQELRKYLRDLPKGGTDFLVTVTRIVTAILSDKKLDISLKDEPDASEAEAPSQREFGLVFAIQQFIASHYADPDISLSMVAKHTYVHPSYVSHIFAEQFNMGFRDYVNSLRIREAKKLLIETGDPIGDICRKVGYSDHSYFNKVFKQREGMTPTAFRTSLN